MRFFKYRHARLALAALAGAAIGLSVPMQMRLGTRLLLSWNVAAWLYLALMLWMMSRVTHRQVKELAEQEDQGAWMIMLAVCLCAAASLIALFDQLANLQDMPSAERPAHYLLVVSTIFTSWMVVGLMFTLHYARVYFRTEQTMPALRFPDEHKTPDYWDFLYFSYTISVAAQTSDVSVTGKPMRRVALVHSILAFFFNMAIIGLSINIAAGIINQ